MEKKHIFTSLSEIVLHRQYILLTKVHAFQKKNKKQKTLLLLDSNCSKKSVPRNFTGFINVLNTSQS